MQRQFKKSRILRRGMLDALAGEGLKTGRGYKRQWSRIISDTFSNMPEVQIKVCLYSFLQCRDITPEERAEVLRLLQLSETALTQEQRQQILFLLQAE